MFRLPTYDVVLWYWVSPETTGSEATTPRMGGFGMIFTFEEI